MEQGSTGMIGAVLDNRLVGAKLDNQGHWSKARQCLPEQGSTAPGARLDRDDRSSALRSIGWSKARHPRALEQGSTVPAGSGWSPNGVITASLLVTGRALSQPETGRLRALSQSKLVTQWCVTALRSPEERYHRSGLVALGRYLSPGW